MPFFLKLGKFSPLKVAGTRAWWEADRLYTLDQNGNGSALGDGSGNAMNMSQSTEGRRPLWVSDGINGRPAFDFNIDATVRNLNTGNVAISRNCAYLTMVIVYQHSATLTSYDSPLTAFIGAGTRAMLMRQPGDSVAKVSARRLDADSVFNSDLSIGRFYDTSPHIAVVEFAWNDAAAYAWLDGIIQISDTTWGTAGSTSDTNASIYLGGISTAVLFYGKVSAAVIYHKRLLNWERQYLIRGFGHKYSIPVTVT